MRKHTPGPWHWPHESNDLCPVNPDPSRSAVSSILTADGGYGFLGSSTADTLAELDADRQLIAAAPTMLEALLSADYAVNMARACLMDSVETHGTHGGWLHEEANRLSGALDEIRAAIVKATGSGA